MCAGNAGCPLWGRGAAGVSMRESEQTGCASAGALRRSIRPVVAQQRGGVPASQPAPRRFNAKVDLRVNRAGQVLAIAIAALRLHADQYDFARRVPAELRAGEGVGEAHAGPLRAACVKVLGCGVAGQDAQGARREPQVEGREHEQTLGGFDDGEQRTAARAAFDKFDLCGAFPARLQTLEYVHAHAGIAPLHVAKTEHDHTFRHECRAPDQAIQRTAREAAYRRTALRRLWRVAAFGKSE
jgi:hypothetical protein